MRRQLASTPARSPGRRTVTDDPYHVPAGGSPILRAGLVLAIVSLVGLIVFAPRGGTDSGSVAAEVASDASPEGAPVEWSADSWPLHLGPGERADRRGSDDWRVAPDPRPKKESDPGL